MSRHPSGIGDGISVCFIWFLSAGNWNVCCYTIKQEDWVVLPLRQSWHWLGLTEMEMEMNF